MEGDAYADKPYLFSPALASWNQFRVGGKVCAKDEVPTVHESVVMEGGEGGEGEEYRARFGVPETEEARRKFYQGEEARKGFVFEEGRVFWADFGNPYLVFNGKCLVCPVSWLVKVE